MDTVEKIWELLKEQNKDVKSLAECVGLGQSKLSDWKAGRSKSYIKYIDKIAEFFNVSVDYLIGLTDDKNDILLLNDIDYKLNKVGYSTDIDKKSGVIWLIAPNGRLKITRNDLNAINICDDYHIEMLLGRLIEARSQYFEQFNNTNKESEKFYNRLIQICHEKHTSLYMVLNGLGNLKGMQWKQGIDPSNSDLALIASSLDVSVGYLLGLTNDPTNYLWFNGINEKLNKTGHDVYVDANNGDIWLIYPDGKIKTNEFDLRVLCAYDGYELISKLVKYREDHLKDFIPGKNTIKKLGAMTGSELDDELFKLLSAVPEDQVQRVKDFVAGMIASREKPLLSNSDKAAEPNDSSPHPSSH
jgi:Predicted transcriptional regulators